MSMRDYGVDDYGLLLTGETLRLLAKNICEDYSDAEYEEKSYDFIDEVCMSLEVEYIGSFTGEAFHVYEDGHEDYNYEPSLYGDTLYYIPLRKYPTLFKAAYSNLSDVIWELKLRVGRYLPVDFDYEGNLRHFVGTYLG